MASRARGSQQNERGSQQKATEREGRFTTGGCRPWLAEIGDFRIKRLFAESLERPRGRLADFGGFCIQRSFADSLERPGPGFGQICRFLY